MPRKPLAAPFETWIEQQIREAQENGVFDDLRGAGKPLADLDEPYDPMWWVKRKLRDEKLSLLPAALQVRLDLERALDARTEPELRERLHRTGRELVLQRHSLETMIQESQSAYEEALSPAAS